MFVCLFGLFVAVLCLHLSGISTPAELHVGWSHSSGTHSSSPFQGWIGGSLCPTISETFRAQPSAKHFLHTVIGELCEGERGVRHCAVSCSLFLFVTLLRCGTFYVNNLTPSVFSLTICTGVLAFNVTPSFLMQPFRTTSDLQYTVGQQHMLRSHFDFCHFVVVLYLCNLFFFLHFCVSLCLLLVIGLDWKSILCICVEVSSLFQCQFSVDLEL